MSTLITPKIPNTQRNLTGELDAIYRANAKYAPQQFALEQQFGPQYNRIAIGNLAEGARGYVDANGNYIPGQTQLALEATGAQRAQDIGDVERYGGRAVQASLAANPYLRASLEDINARRGGTPLLTELNTQALDGLRGGGDLTPEQQRQIDQETAAGFAERGTLMGNQALGTQLLNRDAARRARVAAAQSLASGVQALNFQGDDFAARVAQINAASLADPYQAILSRPGTPVGALQQTGQNRAYQPFDAQGFAGGLFEQNALMRQQRLIEQSRQQQETRNQIAAGFGFSDRRLKKNIVRVGTSPSGIPEYEFEYRVGEKGMPKLLPHGRWRGTIAQDVEKLTMGVVSKGSDGFLRVRYNKTDVKLRLVRELQAEKEAA